ncbi:MAG: signal peptidase I [Planctomycetes bacterium]|nr:signal peptidase I [Planctomycetota bacterium]
MNPGMNPGNQLPDNTDRPDGKPEPSGEGDGTDPRYIKGTESVNKFGNGSEYTEPVEAEDGDAAAVGAKTPPADPVRKRGLLERCYRSAVAEIVVLVLLAFTLAMTTKTYVVEAYEIKGRSMVPTFDDGQRVVVLKMFSDIQRGDIVIFSSQDDPGKDLIKRVIALPGERIQIRKGIVRINGKVLKEGYLEDKDYGLYDAEIDEEVGLGQLYVLGDNRDDSHDSRRFGSVSEESMKGKVVVRWWPFHEVKTF